MKTIIDMYKFAPLVLAAVAAAAPSLPETCTNLPEGFCSGAMVPNVAYTVPAMYGCKGACKEMNIWCQADKEGKAYEYLYCCDDKCVGFPKEQKCTVEGKEYIVGQAYEVTLKGQKECVTMWCINDKEYRTCKGKECGCKPELTPPPPQVCKKPTPCLTCPPVPPKPQPPKPDCDKHHPCPPGSQCVDGKCVPFLPPKPECGTHNPCPPGSQCVDGKCVPFLPPKPQCLLDTDCANQKGCELGCVCSMERCMPSEIFFEPVTPGEEGPQPDTWQPVCTSDADCPTGVFCVDSLCGPPAGPTEGPFPDNSYNSVCSSDNDCGPGQHCDSNNQCHNYVEAGFGPEGDVYPGL